MRNIKISDITLHRSTEQDALPLTFRKKLDVAAILDKMRTDVVELGELPPTTESRLLIKSIISAVQNGTVAVSVGYDAKDADFVWEALKTAKHPRLQVTASLSTSRMEYVYHLKSGDLLPLLTAAIGKCRTLCPDVEFCAEDATRADPAFLRTVLSAAVAAGATGITLCDTSGTMLPNEVSAFLTGLRQDTAELDGISLGMQCSNAQGLADALAVEAVRCGVSEIKASAVLTDTASLSGVVRILNTRQDALGAQCGIGMESLAHCIRRIENLCNLTQNGTTPFEDGVREVDSTVCFTEADSEESINREIERLGYTLSELDRENVYTAFRNIVAKKQKIDLHELEVIVASESMQVPQTYRLSGFVATTGNAVDTFAHVKLERDGKLLDGVSLGNGSVDASFLAIEKIIGCHYELDDFQIQAITEGKEAMGQTLVKLRSHGKVYPGRGVSTDIVNSAVNAYINALNKIVYEEERT